MTTDKLTPDKELALLLLPIAQHESREQLKSCPAFTELLTIPFIKRKIDGGINRSTNKSKREDLRQEAKLQIWLKLGSHFKVKSDNPLKQANELGKWFFTLSANIALNLYRKEKKEWEASCSVATCNIKGTSASVDETPLAQLEAHEMGLLLWKAYQTLDDSEKLIFRLRSAQVPHGAIAEMVGVSLVTARKRYSRIRSKVIDHVSRHGGKQYSEKIRSLIYSREQREKTPTTKSTPTPDFTDASDPADDPSASGIAANAPPAKAA